jgi:hypothetical protein
MSAKPPSSILPGSRRLWLAAILLVAVATGLLFGGLQQQVAPKQAAKPAGVVLPVPPVEPVALREVAPDQARAINARRPIEVKSVFPARPFTFAGDAPSRERAIACLAAAAWYEAGDDRVGQEAVIQVVLNRARHPAFPATICGVVFQGAERTTGCQFTFACDGALARTPSADAWKRAVHVATAMLSGQIFKPVGWSTHYHTDWVVPYWSAELTKAAKVETHIFYLWAGYWGTGAAFRRQPNPSEPFVPGIARLSPAHAASGQPGLTLETASVELTPAIAPDKPPIELEGVSRRSLGATLVRAQLADTNRFFVQLDGKVFAGSYAISALAICKGKTRCSVLGWQDPKMIAQTLPLSEAQRAALTFVYVRSDHDAERALWNCQQVNRPNKAQCLPESAAGLSAVIG